MATLTTKYSIGDVVYRAYTTTERKQHPCPDCLGSRRWKATSPVGGEYEFRCPRCAASYTSDSDLSLWYTASTPAVQRLTIGSIQVNTAPSFSRDGNQYMCQETGIGSGSVYYESDLHETEEAALLAAKVQADLNNKTVEWIVKLYNKALEISDYELESAKLKLAKDERLDARSMLYGLEGLFGRIEDASATKADILEAVDDYKRYDWSRDREKAGLPPIPDIMALHDETIGALASATGESQP
jgi:hypothetical protein